MNIILETKESDRAYAGLVDLLISGQISQGNSLSERSLAERLNLGRTPVREAIKTLVREGVLESHATRGTLLMPMSLADLQNFYEIRFAIEGLAAFLAAERGEVENLQPFVDAFEQTLKKPASGNINKVHNHGIDFHFEVVRLANNPPLLELYRPFRLKFRIPNAIVGEKNPERVLTSVSEHLLIAKAIMARDADRSRSLICDHLQTSLDYRMGLHFKRSNYAVPLSKTETNGRKSRCGPTKSKIK